MQFNIIFKYIIKNAQCKKKYLIKNGKKTNLTQNRFFKIKGRKKSKEKIKLISKAVSPKTRF